MSPSIAPLLRHGAVAVAIAGVLVSSVILTRGRAAVAQETPPTEVVAGSAPASGLGGKDFIADRDAIFDAFYTTGLDTTKPYSVSNLAIRKDNMTLLLRQGTVFLMRPIAGEVTGAAFVGEGEAQMTPPNRMERYMLNKYYGAEVLKEPFSEAVFRFTDGTDKAIVLSGKPDPAGAGQATRAAEVHKERNGWLDGDRSFDFEMQWVENRISGLRGLDFFIADFRSAKHDWLEYIFDPSGVHENSIATSETLGAKNKRYRVIWTEWHEQAEYAPSGHYILHPERDGPRLLRIRHNEMTLNMPTTKTVEWEARMRIEPAQDNLRAFRLYLANNGDYDSRWSSTAFYPARLQSVKDESGAALSFTHRRDNVLVLLPQPTKAGSAVTLVFKGAADVIYQLTAESFGLLQIGWYPHYGYAGRSSFHWTVRVPRPFLVTGSGKMVREFEDKEAGMNGLETKCDEPSALPWVIFGRFQKATSTYVSEGTGRSVPLTIHSFPRMTISVTDPGVLERIGADTPFTLELSAPLKKVNGFFDEGKEVLRLYEKIYGPYPFDELHVAQMAPFLGYGQAPQGFVQLTGEAFMSQAQLESDFFHGFFAHEIAHQWWGHQIGGASSDDEWLGEAFAEYASGLFVKEFQGAKRFQRTLDDWRRDAKYSDKEAPIAAANTLRGPNGFRHRSNILYDKGPYVLHMLRVQLDDAKYVEVMKSIQQNFKHQNLSTEMLLREVNKVSGQDYTGFFDQWVWDVGVPTFRYSWRSEKQPDGKFLVTIHVSQEDKARVKKVLLPVHLHVKDKPIPTQYRPVVQAEQDIKLLLPMEPKNVTLDDERTLLAEFVKE